MSSGRPAIRLRSVSKRFGRTWALRDATLDVERGGSVAMVGPNGAGKTTLLKILAGLYAPSTGHGEVLGLPLAGGSEEIRRRVALLAGQDFLYDELTGRENLVFSLRMSGRPADEAAVGESLGRVGLSRGADRRVRTYSTGMRKRLALGRLLLQQGELVLLDEPYAGLDREGVALVDRVVAEHRSTGKTVILATHQPGESVRDADRSVLVRHGRLSELPPGDDPLEAVAAVDGESAASPPAGRLRATPGDKAP